MIIVDSTTALRGKVLDSQLDKKGDILSIVKFNALPSPVTAKMFGGDEYWIETLCVQTGCMRLDVSGQIDLSEFSMVKTLIDSDGNEHDPDEFWIED